MTDSFHRLECPSRPLKRRYTATADLSFFTPSSVTFNPKPYFPHSSHSINHEKAVVQAVSREPSNTPPKPFDPAPDDPTAVFIHPPFDDFPNAYLYSEGLTYSLLAENPEWFLDPVDFKCEGDPNPNAIVYPQALEPPRGWCPTKKKDLRGRGTDVWADEDAPKLRCTFCRRKYAGVNAKSMWRRHVLEKHKIPMSNRRDGPCEAGGRASRTANKENKRFPSSTSNKYFTQGLKSASDDHLPSSSAPSEALTQPFGLHNRHSQVKLRSLLPAGGVPEANPEQAEVLSLPLQPRGPTFTVDENNNHTSPLASSCLSVIGYSPSSPLNTRPIGATESVVPPSPYDPTRTPSFKHTRQGLLCKQPWKFPSPSHPLHSSPEELCLGVPIGGIAGDGLQSSYIPLQSSPFALPRASSAMPLSSPAANASPLSSKLVTGRVLGWKRSSTDCIKTPHPVLPEPEPRRLFYSGPLPVPVTDRLEVETPNLSTSTDMDDFDSSFSSLGDPFLSWFDMNRVAQSPSKSMADVFEAAIADYSNSPTRNSIGFSFLDQFHLGTSAADDATASWTLQPSGLGLGITLSPKRSLDGTDDDNQEDQELVYPPWDTVPCSVEGTEVEEPGYPPPSQESEGPEDSPSTEDESEEQTNFPFNAPPPLKRRKTIW